MKTKAQKGPAVDPFAAARERFEDAMTAALFARRAWPADTRPRTAWAALFGLATVMTVVGMYGAALSYASRKGARGMVVFKYVAAASLIFCAELTLLSIATRALESWLR